MVAEERRSGSIARMLLFSVEAIKGDMGGEKTQEKNA